MKTDTYTHIHTYIQSDENAQPSALHTPPTKATVITTYRNSDKFKSCINLPQAQTGADEWDCGECPKILSKFIVASMHSIHRLLIP